MAYYDALIAKWPELGAATATQTAIDAAKVALASQPPSAPEGMADAETWAAYDAAANARLQSYANIFHTPEVIAKLDALNAMTVASARRTVPIADIMQYLRTNNLWLPIRNAQATVVGAAAAVDYNSDVRATTLDFDLPIVKAMLADLVTHNLLSQAQSDALDAMANTTIPWWQSVGYTSSIGTGDLEAVFVQNGGTALT